MLLCGGLALFLYTLRVWWWYSPLAVVGIALAHTAILGGIVFIAHFARVIGRQHGQGGTARRHEGVAPSCEDKSILLHNPGQFDFMARICTLGQERKLRRWTLDLADLQAGNVVLDVGCGTGTLLLEAAERVGPSGTLHGVELSPDMAAYARQKAQARQVPLDIVEGSAESLPYPPASFDAVFCTLVLHHLPRSGQQGSIREMRRVLRPGGRVVIVDWQRPNSFRRAIASPMFLMCLLHNLASRRSPLDTANIEPLMKELGFEDIARCSFGTGGGVGAIVGRLARGMPGTNRSKPQDTVRAGSDV